MKIITHQINPPIPVKCFDWIAMFDTYDEGDPVGRGETEDKAILDLMEQQYMGEIA